MVKDLFEIIIESMPFMKGIIILGIVIGSLVYFLMKGLARFEKVEVKTTNLEVEVSKLTAWTKTADLRFKEIDLRFNEVDNRFNKVEIRLDNLENRMEKVEIKLDRMDEKFDRKFDTIISLLLSKKTEETADS